MLIHLYQHLLPFNTAVYIIHRPAQNEDAGLISFSFSLNVSNLASMNTCILSFALYIYIRINTNCFEVLKSGAEKGCRKSVIETMWKINKYYYIWPRRNGTNQRHYKEERLIELVTADVGTAFLKHVTEETVEGAGRQRTRRKQLPDDLKGTKSYWKLKEEVLDRTQWRIRFERGCRPVVRLRSGKTASGSNIGLKCRNFSYVF